MSGYCIGNGHGLAPEGPGYQADPKDHEILWLVDYGTKTLGIGVQIIRKGKRSPSR